MKRKGLKGYVYPYTPTCCGRHTLAAGRRRDKKRARREAQNQIAEQMPAPQEDAR